jgi:hypothetical protein
MVRLAPFAYSTDPPEVEDQPANVKLDLENPLLVIACAVPAVNDWLLMLPLVAVLESKVRAKAPAVHLAYTVAVS